MSRASQQAVTAQIVAHGDSEIARLRERVRVLEGALQSITDAADGDSEITGRKVHTAIIRALPVLLLKG